MFKNNSDVFSHLFVTRLWGKMWWLANQTAAIFNHVIWWKLAFCYQVIIIICIVYTHDARYWNFKPDYFLHMIHVSISIFSNVYNVRHNVITVNHIAAILNLCKLPVCYKSYKYTIWRFLSWLFLYLTCILSSFVPKSRCIVWSLHNVMIGKSDASLINEK